MAAACSRKRHLRQHGAVPAAQRAWQGCMELATPCAPLPPLSVPGPVCQAQGAAVPSQLRPQPSELQRRQRPRRPGRRHGGWVARARSRPSRQSLPACSRAYCCFNPILAWNPMWHCTNYPTPLVFHSKGCGRPHTQQSSSRALLAATPQTLSTPKGAIPFLLCLICLPLRSPACCWLQLLGSTGCATVGSGERGCSAAAASSRHLARSARCFTPQAPPPPRSPSLFPVAAAAALLAASTVAVAACWMAPDAAAAASLTAAAAPEAPVEGTAEPPRLCLARASAPPRGSSASPRRAAATCLSTPSIACWQFGARQGSVGGGGGTSQSQGWELWAQQG